MVFQRIVRSLKVAGTSAEYVIRRTTYLVDPEKNVRVVGELEKKYLPYPKASSTIGVTALARPGMLIEVDIMAIKPKREKRARKKA